MSDIMADLRRVDANLTLGRPPKPAEILAREHERSLASLYLWKHAYDLHEMVMGDPVPFTRS